MKVTIKAIEVFRGREIESNWKMPCQLVTDTENNVYVNTPQITNKTFKVGETVNVTFGSTFGRSSGNRYKTISPSRY